MNHLTHPSVISSATAGAVLVLGSSTTTVPWWLWAAWAVLTLVALGQAITAARADRPRGHAR